MAINSCVIMARYDGLSPASYNMVNKVDEIDKLDSLSSISRGPEGTALVEFADTNNLSTCWTGDNITVMISGNTLDNLNSRELYVKGSDNIFYKNLEYLIHLFGKQDCTLNLANVLAMATMFCRQQQKLSRDMLKSVHGDRSILKVGAKRGATTKVRAKRKKK